MNELMYSFRDNNVRVVNKDGEAWFAAKDVCEVLDIKNTTQAVQRLEQDEVTMLNIGGLSGQTYFVNEYGLYTLVLGSRKKEAKDFKRWITHEVIPSIRKNGLYASDNVLDKAINDPDFMIGLLNQIKQERESKKKLEYEIQQQQPKVLLAESIGNSDSLILIRDLAVILKQNGVDIGEKRLFEFMRNKGFLVKAGTSKNMPTHRSVQLGLFRIMESTYTGSSGVKINKTPKVTGKGQCYFVNKFLKELK